MNIDFNPPNRADAPPRRSRWPFLLLILTLAVAAGGFFLNTRLPVTDSEARPEAAQASPSPPPAPEVRKEVVKGEFNSGDTIAGLLGRYFSPQEIHQLATESRKVFPLSGICAGQSYQICLTNGAFDRLSFDIDQGDQLVIRKEEDGFNVSRIPIPYTVKEQLVSGEISSSLFESVESIGESSRAGHVPRRHLCLGHRLHPGHPLRGFLQDPARKAFPGRETGRIRPHPGRRIHQPGRHLPGLSLQRRRQPARLLRCRWQQPAQRPS